MRMMMMLSFALITFVLVVGIDGQPIIEHDEEPPAAATTQADRVLYDQRQSGKYNIHVSIKDVAIIEVDQNEIVDEAYDDEDDYYYDDSALTIKPIKFTTETTESTTPPTKTTATISSSSEKPVITTIQPEIGITLTPTSSPFNLTAYSANLLADIARIRPKSNKSNLIIMETPIGGSSTPRQPLSLQDVPVPMAKAVPRPLLPENIEYTPPQGHNSPIFKVKVQRAASETSARCQAHQFRDAHGKCRSKRSGSILKKLFSMLVSLPFAGERRRGHGHGLEVSSHPIEG
ncbi:uncharacterized protein Dwil_GK15697 [Drosophila willistoni]|uniref:DUF4794 domain-containing protein n=2 Tax=Drosophila willistoni TaxID=7260 RepID=B4MRS9_DROWI|nr:uncharacterized protein Dwil_GK15697 [Drosophila willistoni]